MSRQTGFSLTVRRFLDRLGLTSLWEHHDIDYTHVHTDDRSVTSLDHFICNERLLPLVTDAGVLHFGDNTSRHSPIMVRLDMGALPVKQKSTEVRPRRPAWYKASEAHIKSYKADLQGRLEAIPVPECLECQDATAIRKIRRSTEQIKAQKLLEASRSGGSDLMNELKKARGGKHTPDLPENVAGANGEE